MILGICPRRVRVLITDGRLKAKKFGRDYMICYDDLDAVRVRRPGRPTKIKKPPIYKFKCHKCAYVSEENTAKDVETIPCQMCSYSATKID